ncbi:hypothetical protein GCM10029978_011680 [Actinoallomurus acanthiterrae]
MFHLASLQRGDPLAWRLPHATASGLGCNPGNSFFLTDGKELAPTPGPKTPDQGTLTQAC